MKKLLKTALVLGIIGVIAYKAYQYFNREDDLGLDGDGEEVPETEASLAGKIKAAAQKAVN